MKKVLLEMGSTSIDATLDKEIITGIKRRRHVVSRVTTRGGLGKTVEQRIASVSLYKLEKVFLCPMHLPMGFRLNMRPLGSLPLRRYC